MVQNKITGLEPGKSYIFQVGEEEWEHIQELVNVLGEFAKNGGFKIFVVKGNTIERVVGVDDGEYITWEDLENFELSEEQKELYRSAVRRRYDKTNI